MKTMLLVSASLLAITATNTASADDHVCPDGEAYAWGETVSWTDETGPVAREHAVLLADPRFNRLVLIAGSGYTPQVAPVHDAWAFDIETRTWQALEFEAPQGIGGSLRATSLDDRGIAFAHGGYNAQQQPQSDVFRIAVSETRVEITPVDIDASLPGRMLHAVWRADDAETMAVFGGVTLDAEGAFGLSNDTVSVDMASGSVEAVSPLTSALPPARYGFAIARDNSDVLVWGGADFAFPADQTAELWRMTPTDAGLRWTRVEVVNPELAPTPRRNPQFGYNADTRDLMIWGGTSDGRTATADGRILHLSHSGPEWHVIPDGPPLRASGMAVSMPGSAAIWTGFGNTEVRFQDLTPLYNCAALNQR